MITAFKSIYIIFKNEGSISFNKVKNFGFLRYDRGKTYILNNKYEIAFENLSGDIENLSEDELKDISSFILRNKETIEKILDSKENEKLIEDLN